MTKLNQAIIEHKLIIDIYALIEEAKKGTSDLIDQSTLPCALLHGHLGVINTLLEANPPITSDALNCALIFNHINTVKKLIGLGALPNEHTLNCALALKNNMLIKLIKKLGAEAISTSFTIEESKNFVVSKYTKQVIIPVEEKQESKKSKISTEERDPSKKTKITPQFFPPSENADSNKSNLHVEENDIFTEICLQGYSDEINSRKSIIFKHLRYGEKIEEPFASMKISTWEEGELLSEPMENVKIHISLTYGDYKRYKDEVKDIIIGYLMKNKINRFKMVNCVALEEKLAKENNKSLDRFRDGDQFTIYIPKNYSEKNISSLLDAINNFIKEHNITENGEQSDVAISITPQINIRLEYFSSGEDKKKINAVKNDDEEESRRSRAGADLKKHQLYIHLIEFFSRDQSLKYKL